MGFLVSQKIDFKSCFQTWKLTDRPSRSTGRSTEARSGRLSSRPTCTDLCTLSAQWTGRPGGRPIQRGCSLEMSSRPLGRPTVHSRSSVDRPVDRRAATVRNMTVGRSTGRSTDSADRAPTAIFLAAYKRGSCQLF